MEDKDIVAILWILSIFITPLITTVIMFFFKDKNEFNRKHFNYMLNFLIINIVLGTFLFVGGTILGFITFGIGLILIIPIFLLYLLYCLGVAILGALNAHNGKDEVPFVPLIIQL
jgi:uncharacterized membrane protein SpoIIM required for sporulation